MDAIWVGLFGFFGAVIRYGFYSVERRLALLSFPLGTLAINTVGCFLLGLCLGAAEKATFSNKHLLALFNLGFVGSFTTFSAFSGETLYLLKEGFTYQGILNIILNVSAGIMMIIVGKWLIG